MTGSGHSPSAGWRRTWWLAFTVYVTAGMLLLPFQAALVAIVPTVLVISAIVAFMVVGLSEDTKASSRAHLLLAGRLGLLCAVSLLATMVLLELLGPVSLVLACGLALCSPWVLGRFAGPRHRDGVPQPSPDPRAPGSARHAPYGGPHPHVATMSTREIATAWGQSYWRLEKATTCHARMQIVAERQQLLDELERRDPLAVRRWLDSGPRAAADPAKYFPHDEPPEALAS